MRMRIWIQIILSAIKKIKSGLKSTLFLLFNDLLSLRLMKSWKCYTTTESNKQKNFEKNLLLAGILKSLTLSAGSGAGSGFVI